MSLAPYLRVHSNSEGVSYLSWQNTHRNLKTSGHIKLKFFLWTEHLENLLLAKYFISVAAASNNWHSKIVEGIMLSVTCLFKNITCCNVYKINSFLNLTCPYSIIKKEILPQTWKKIWFLTSSVEFMFFFKSFSA